MDGVCMEIHLNDCEDVRPMCIFTTRQIPLHFQEDANKIINDAIDEGIITCVDVPMIGVRWPSLCGNHLEVSIW